VLLASERVFADALASGALQGDRPLLLNDPDALEGAVLDEIGRLGADTVRILGGEAAVSAAVADALIAVGLPVVRTAGATRLETAIAIAELTGSESGFVARAYPAEGAADPTQAFADSLALGGWAAEDGSQVLLSETDRLSDSTASWLGSAMLGSARVIGGEAAVSAPVEEAVRALVGSAERVSGSNRFATAVALAEARSSGAADLADAVIVIEGQAANAWAAGFTAAALSAVLDAPIVLVNGDEVPSETEAFLTTSVAPTADVVCAASTSVCAAVVTLVR
jgi:uncharacterized protein